MAEEENVSHAAARLHIAQPALSRRMLDLESQLGIALFVRTGRSIRLTAAGQHFLVKARDVVSHLDQVLDSVKDLDSKCPKELRVGYVPSMSSRFLPEVLREMRKSFPWVQVTLFDLNTEAMVTGLTKGDLAAAIMVKPSESSLRGIDYHEIATYAPCVVMPSGHPLSIRGEVDTIEIAGYPLAVFCRSGYPEHHVWLRGIFGPRTQLKIQSECDTVASLLAMVEAGEGVAVVQEGFESLGSNGIIASPIRGASQHAFSFGIACRSNDDTPELKGFLDQVVRGGKNIPRKVACG